LGCWAVGLLKIKKFLVDPPALTGQAVGPGGGLRQQKAESRNDLANRTMTDLIGITIHAWQRVPGGAMMM